MTTTAPHRIVRGASLDAYLDGAATHPAEADRNGFQYDLAAIEERDDFVHFTPEIGDASSSRRAAACTASKRSPGPARA